MQLLSACGRNLLRKKSKGKNLMEIRELTKPIRVVHTGELCNVFRMVLENRFG